MKPPKDQILECLEVVKDPEIPVLSLVDLGVISEITVEEKELQKITFKRTTKFI